jgi:hypothetical protein
LASLKSKRILVDDLLEKNEEIEIGMAEKSSWDQANRRQKNLVWFGEIERKLAKLSKTTFTYRSSSYLFYGFHPYFPSSFVPLGFIPSSFAPLGFVPSSVVSSDFVTSFFVPLGFVPYFFVPFAFFHSSSTL